MLEIPAKEAIDIEFKSDLATYPDDELVDEIVGMANTEGGILYLGVEDDAKPTGLSKKHQDAIGAAALIANKTVPSLSVRTEIVNLGDISIMTIEIPKSRAIIATSSGKILRRRLKADGSPENIPLYPFEINSRLSDLSLLDFSAQPVYGAELTDLDPNQIVRLKEIIQNRDGDRSLLELSDEEIEKALHFVTEVQKDLVPTVTGLLMIGKESAIRRLVPTMAADFQVLQGTEVVINRSYRKPIIELCELFEEYLKPWNPEKEMEYGLFRIPVPEFSIRAFREGLVNAFAHRDYSMLGSVRVLIDDDGMTISSPGGFIEGVNLNNLLTVEPHGRNQALSDALKRVGLAEKTGRGIDRIFEGSINYGRPWPDYSESTSVRVTLFIARSKADLPFTKMIADEQNKLGRPLSINYLLILSALKAERRMSLERLQEVTHINKNRILAVIESMVEDGLVEEFGSGRTRSFMLSSQLYQRAGKTKEYVRQSGIDKVRYEEMVVKLARQQKGIITKQDVIDLLHIESQRAYRCIANLVSEKKLKKIQNGRYAKYCLMD